MLNLQHVFSNESCEFVWCDHVVDIFSRGSDICNMKKTPRVYNWDDPQAVEYMHDSMIQGLDLGA